jgi:WhiB family redox-sensing transcriptional regulator
MDLHPRTMYPGGSQKSILLTPGPVIEIRISSTQPASPSTARWISANSLPDDDYIPETPEQQPYRWGFFPEWHDDAKCRSVSNPDDMFFGESDDHTKTTMTVSKLREVKEFCRSCPVFETCLRHALTTPERHGIWAGTSKRTRLRILALIDSGRATVEAVVQDYLAGRERKYESIRHQG